MQQKWVFGINVGGKYMLNDNMALGLDLGYQMFSAKEEVDGVSTKFSIIPIAPSFTYYFATEGFKPYVGANVGFYMWKAKAEFMGASISTTATKLGFAPVLGFEYALGEKMGLDVNAKYNYITTEGSATTYLGINVGLVFGL
ncbi:MAG TPA: OmpW family outer membrane protein [Bacteroidales bacterium]|nr:OmpW family outer membrane protein [Bacteroidales bacterium]